MDDLDKASASGIGLPMNEADKSSSPSVGIPDAEPDEIVWLRDLDGTGSMHVCPPHDPGAIAYYREDIRYDR